MLHHSKTRSRPQLVRAKSPLVSAQKITFGQIARNGRPRQEEASYVDLDAKTVRNLSGGNGASTRRSSEGK